MLKGGDNGASLVPGSPDKSKIIEAIRYANADLQMPPRGKLTDAAIADLTAWVKAGAVWPNDSAAVETSVSAFDLAKRKKEHWAWQPVRPTAPPMVKNASWPSDPIDQFILAKLEEKGIKSAGPADPRSWIRRVTYDLTGLPPTPDEVDRFVREPTVDARRMIVDRLLASSHFGERWGRHWLDLVRYAETRGHEFDAIIPNAHHYRDYVIRALNADVPYDQFVREHVAGDLLKSPRKHPKEGFNESILGTGFWFLGEEVHSPVDIRQDQADRFDNRIDVLTKTFLAMTVSCARCHDHKFDAIGTKDYYALYGFLESSGYRLVRYDSLDQNRAIAKELAEVDRRGGLAVAAALSRHPTERIAEYLLAAREAIRTGPEYGTDAGVVFEDFEDGTYARWEVKGTAFGAKPHTLETIAPYQGKINGQGKYFVNSHDIRPGGDTARGDALTGTMTSREFKIDHTYITMLVGGGSHAGKTCVNLIINDKIVRTATGRDNNQMFPVRWDVRELKGKAARIQIVDDATGGWGNIGVDDIRFANSDKNGERTGVVRSLEFSEKFRARIEEIAKTQNLSTAELLVWVEATINAMKDPAHPLHVWSNIASDLNADNPKRFKELLASLRSAAPEPATRQQVIVDYSNGKPHEFLPDEGSFGTRPVQPGDLRLGADRRPRFAEHAAAEYDPTWDNLQSSPGAELDHGTLGRRMRAGRTLRTSAFRLTSSKVHYLVSGSATAYAAVDGHTLIAGPLHAKLIFDFTAGTGFRWITHDLSGYQGHVAHIEFTPLKEGRFAVAMVVQSDEVPPAPTASSFVPAGEFDSAKGLAEAYGKTFASIPVKLKQSLPISANEARIVNHMLAQSLAAKRDDVDSALSEFIASRTKVAAGIRTESRLSLAMYEGTGVDEHVFIRGSPRGLGDRVPRRFLEAFAGTNGITTGQGSGRLELADQMVDPNLNPLISRVIVNRVWHHLFGRGIVPSVDNFGKLGELPTHPELLDYLAHRFVRDGWSLKGLIRDLVLSSSYGMATKGDAEADTVDPQNLLLHKSRLRRLDGESIRDAMLAISGRLNRSEFGPPVPIHLTPFLDGRGRPGVSGPLDGDGRRSIYLSVRRNFLNPLLLAFDTPIPFSTVGKRQVSNVPAQALILLNDPFVQLQAEMWAKKLCAAEADTTKRLVLTYRQAFGREPNHDEVIACQDFLLQQAQRHNTKDDWKVWKDLAHTLFNTKEFIYLD
jgi:cytochrome c553/predicted DNA-binding ribbon-helix-helix protein